MGNQVNKHGLNKAEAPLADKMKVLLRQAYDFEFHAQQQDESDINNDNGGEISDNDNEDML